MDANLGGILALVAGVALWAILWIRVRAYEALAVEKSIVRVQAANRAVESLNLRLAPLNDELGTHGERRKRRQGKKHSRRRS